MQDSFLWFYGFNVMKKSQKGSVCGCDMVWHAVRWQGLAWLLVLGLNVAAFASCDWPWRPTSLLFTPPQFLSHNTASSSSSLRPNTTVLKMRVAGKESTILNRTATSKLYIHGELSRSYFCTLGAQESSSTFVKTRLWVALRQPHDLDHLDQPDFEIYRF